MEFHPKSCIRGYHEYGEQWDAFLGEQLICQCKVDNVTERYAVNVKKDSSKAVGHMLKKISRVSSAFLQHGFIITATVRSIGIYGTYEILSIGHALSKYISSTISWSEFTTSVL